MKARIFIGWWWPASSVLIGSERHLYIFILETLLIDFFLDQARASSAAKTRLRFSGPTRPTELSVVAALYDIIQSLTLTNKWFEGGFRVLRLR